MSLLNHPLIPFVAAAFLGLFLKGLPKKIVQLTAPVIALISVIKLNFNSSLTFGSLSLLNVDVLSLLFLFTFVSFGFLAHLYALHTNGSKEHNVLHTFFSNLYIASSIGAVLAGDLITLFIFWELMAVTSVFLIWNPARKTSEGAAYRYFLFHLVGGLFFFSGLLIKILGGASLEVTRLSLDLSGILIFIGFAVNAGLPPLHAWLPDAYPEGTPSSSVYLSAFTTKVAVYAFARCFWGEEILIYLGAVAAVYGVIYALMENDMRKLLSYHIICQIGYMLCGIGIGSHLGINAGVGHAIGNILFKGLLFMATGALIHMTGTAKLNELGNMKAHSKLTFLFFMIGAFAISGLPGLNGYITKSFLFASAIKSHNEWLELILIVVAAGTFLSIGCKLAYFAFIHKNNVVIPDGSEPSRNPLDSRRSLSSNVLVGDGNDIAQEINPIPWNMHAAMMGASLLCLWIGLFPNTFYTLLPYTVEKNPFTLDHILHTLQLLLGTALGFALILQKLHLKDTLTLDIDWFYRKSSLLFINYFCVPIRKIQENIQGRWTLGIMTLNHRLGYYIGKQKMASAEHSLFLICLACFAVGIFFFFLQAV